MAGRGVWGSDSLQLGGGWASKDSGLLIHGCPVPNSSHCPSALGLKPAQFLSLPPGSKAGFSL